MKQVSKVDHLKAIVLESASKNFAEWCIANGYKPDKESKGYYEYCKKSLNKELALVLLNKTDKSSK